MADMPSFEVTIYGLAVAAWASIGALGKWVVNRFERGLTGKVDTKVYETDMKYLKADLERTQKDCTDCKAFIENKVKPVIYRKGSKDDN